MKVLNKIMRHAMWLLIAVPALSFTLQSCKSDDEMYLKNIYPKEMTMTVNEIRPVMEIAEWLQKDLEKSDGEFYSIPEALAKIDAYRIDNEDVIIGGQVNGVDCVQAIKEGSANIEVLDEEEEVLYTIHVTVI